MAHQRIIKAEFFTDADMGELSPLLRLFFIGLWTQADRNGTLEDKPKQLKARVLPYDDFDAAAATDELVVRGKLVRFKVGARLLLSIASWKKNQSIHQSEKASGLPDVSQASEIVALPLINRLDTVSSTLATAISESRSAPVPSPVPGPGPAFPTPPKIQPRSVAVEKPTRPVSDWQGQDFQQWAQWKRQEVGLVPEESVPIFELEEWWGLVRTVIGSDVKLIQRAFLAFGEDPHWGHKDRKPKLPFRAFISQWRKYMPQMEVGNAQAG